MPSAAFLARIYAASFLYDGSFYVVMTVVALRAIALGASSLQLGLMPVLGSGSYVLAALVLGHLSDRWPRFAMARIGCVLRAAAVLGVIGAGDPVSLLWWMPVLGASNGFFWPGLQAVLGTVAEGERLGRVLGGFNVGWSTGKMLGFFLGGFFLERVGHAPVLVAAAFATFAPALILPWREVRTSAGTAGDEHDRLDRHDPNDRLDPCDPNDPSEPTDLHDSRDPRDPRDRDPIRRGLPGGPAAWSRWRQLGWAANFVLFGLGATLNFHYPKFLDAHGLGGGAVFGAFLGIVYLSQTVFFVVAGLWHGWPFRLWPLAGTQIACATGVGMLLVLRAPVAIWAVAPLVGIGLGFAYSSSIYYSLHGSRQKGQSTGIHEALLGSGSFLLPFLAGVLVDLTGSLAAPYLLLVGALLVLVIFETTRVVVLRVDRGARLPGA
ncbi:MAG: MFS transporter [Candidatus Eisenbacteria bacterium]|uniref:MFS transporter n=1 Tax=Eiseniibacteriota bacterium TaxID=2212470 RepID=A0A956RQ56_UNCEI|nr:MFS transporter [Candidatus Eisenbacteria bacterium]